MDSTSCDRRKDFPQGLKPKDRSVLMSELKLRPQNIHETDRSELSEGFRIQLDSRDFVRDLASGWWGVQSFGGKATCQNMGLGSRNSTPTWGWLGWRRSMCATMHSSAALVWTFDRVSRCPL